ncbi:nucleoporin NUP188-like [Diadema setosum]|uniref:nucleoporin NUP188-like n=1 Tax=Diadema setosum TaxID=31175 RepID=UPI003B3B34EE
MAAFTTSAQELLLIISGHSALRAKDLIRDELVDNKKRLLEGVLVYKKHNDASEQKLKKQKEISELERKFLLRMCRFLDLDALQCRELFNSYLINAFRGTDKQLQAILKDERSVQAMLLKVWDFYHADRLHLLQCIKHLANFWQDEDHPYQVQYAEFVEDLQSSGLFKKLVAQYEDRFGTLAPSKETAGPLMTERQRIRWCIQSLREQSELLGIILLFLHASLTPTEKLSEVMKLFQQQGFGTRQPYRHLLDTEEIAQKLTSRIEFLCCVILLECMDLFPLMAVTDESSIENHPLVVNKSLSKEFSSAVQSLGQSTSHAPILLAWMVFQTIAWPGKDQHLVKRLGNQALRLHVFKYLKYGLCETLPDETSEVTMACHSVVYSLMSVILSVFQEDTLGGLEDLLALSCQLLSQPHLCREFWSTDIEGGFAALLQSAMSSFPLEFSRPMRFLKALATEGSRQIYNLLAHLPTFTEPLDNNRSSDIEITREENVWKLVSDKVVCKADKHSPGFVIPVDTLGRLEQRPDGPPLITWDVEYNGCQLFQCVLDWLISAAPTTSPSDTLVQQTQDVVDLMETMLQSDWSIATELQSLTDCILPLLGTLVQVKKPPLLLIASCVKCLATMAKYEPEKMWQSLQQTGFLPYTGTLYTQLDQAARGVGVFAGSYGKVVLEWERHFGAYPVTLEFLRLLHTLIQGLSSTEIGVATSQDLLACVIFLQRDIFTSYQKWRYGDLREREKIGLGVMEVFHVVLHVVPRQPSSRKARSELEQKHGISVRSACIHGLLYTSAGQTLLTIAATGVDTIEQSLLESGSFLDSAPNSQCQLVKLSLSVLNRLLLLKPHQTGAVSTSTAAVSTTGPAVDQCPLEMALTAHSTGLPHQPHLIAVIASYIYHQQDPRLPTLAVLLLRRLALVAPMSLFGCLGNQAPAFRNAFLYRLQTHSEDIRLKVGILALLAVSAETQPGFSELFLDLQPKKSGKKTDKEEEKKKSPNKEQDLELGKNSCLHAVLEILDETKQGTTHSPPDLHCAALGFLQALWQDHRETALSTLRNRPKFWSNVAAPLFQDPPTPKPESTVTSSLVKMRAHALKILALECFLSAKSDIPAELKDVLKKIDEKKRFQSWSKFVVEVLSAYSPSSVDIEEYMLREHEGLVLVQAWRTILVVAASPNYSSLTITDPAVRSTILNDLVAAIHKQACSLESIFNAKALALLSSIYLTLINKWTSNLGDQWSKVKLLVDTLEAILDSEDTPLLARCQATTMGALCAILRHRRQGQTRDKQGLDLPLFERLLPPICVALQHSRAYHTPSSPPTQQPPPQAGSIDIVMDDLDSSVIPDQSTGTDIAKNVTETPSIKPQIQLPVVAAYLLDELLLVQSEQTQKWMPLLREHSVVSLLLSTLQACLQSQKGLHYVEAVMTVLKDLAAVPQAAEAVRMTGFVEHTCLSLVRLYEDDSKQHNTWKKNTRDTETDITTWLDVYVESITVTTTLLATLSHAFLPDALNFFGVHRVRIMECLESLYLLPGPLNLTEALASTTLIYQLAHHVPQWRFHMSKELGAVQETMARLTRSIVALLIRPRLLQHMMEMRTKGKELSQSQELSQLTHSTSRRLLQHQISTEQVDSSVDSQTQQVQTSLVTILSHTLSALRLFSPDLLETLLNQSLDVTEYPVLYSLGFSTPSLDQKTPASFGTLLSCINWCLQMLPKLDVSKTPMKVTEQKTSSSPDKGIQRSSLLFVLENAVLLIMAQGMRIFRDPSIPPRDRQLLKRELGSELNTFLTSLQRYFRRGKLGSPSDASPGTAGGLSARLATGSATGSLSKASLNAAFTEAKEQLFFKVVQVFVQQLIK